MAEAFEIPDFETTRAQMTAFASNRAPEFRTSPVDFLGELIGTQAQVQQALGENTGRSADDAVPSENTSTVGLDTWGDALGMYSGTPGKYGRRAATKALGAAVQLSGDKGTAYLAGQAATGPGGVAVKLRDAKTIAGTPPGTGTITGIIDAASEGEPLSRAVWRRIQSCSGASRIGSATRPTGATARSLRPGLTRPSMRRANRCRRSQ